jgi:hypothetical protein
MLTSAPVNLRYDVAQLYLKQAGWDLEAAIQAYREDERWEQDHPVEGRSNLKKGKAAADAGIRRFLGTSRAR